MAFQRIEGTILILKCRNGDCEHKQVNSEERSTDMRKVLFVVSLIVLTSLLGSASAQQKPEQKPEQKAEQKAEQKPEAKPEQKPEAKPEQKPEAKPEQKPEAKPEQKPEQKQDESASQAAKILVGEVVTVDATKNEIVIKNEGGVEVHLSIVASTKIFRADKAIVLADVKVGDSLTCECESGGEGCKAKGIVVTSPEPKP